MRSRIKDIATIQSGFAFRGPVITEKSGDILVVQGGNVNAGSFGDNTDELMRINSDSIRNPIYLQQDDVLLVARGSGPGSFRSVVFYTGR